MWGGDPPCAECDHPGKLFAGNQLAWRCWNICNQAGREGFGGIMQAVNIIATLSALGGSEEDLDKVLAIEVIAQGHRKKDGNSGDDEDDE